MADALSGSAKAIDVIYLQREVEWLQMAAGLQEMKHLGPSAIACQSAPPCNLLTGASECIQASTAASDAQQLQQLHGLRRPACLVGAPLLFARAKNCALHGIREFQGSPSETLRMFCH